jgi:4-hydroxy-3-polyprenylbenzoate decarboxylase
MTMVPEIVDMEMPVEGVFHNLVITKIKKDFAGQGQKVMNAMWGAGQMMFNKILVLTSGNVDLSNYEEVARNVFRNLNPATDIYFSQGPMDVLDHSCSKLGFGGKMCIDGTEKFEEEKEDEYQLAVLSRQSATVDEIITNFAEVKGVNTSLLENQIPVLIISVEKNRKGHIKELHQQICGFEQMQEIKLILYVEHTVDANDLPIALWRFCNNLDPKRDNILHDHCLGFDGTRKTKELDDFHRDWPNIIVADEATIKAVDEKWEQLGIGQFISSPSLKFKSQMYGEEAVVQ